MVHHAVKRFMIIMPAIFFKLGIAFTLLILVALAAVNNGIIGFLILVVGLSSVLARLQGQGPPPVPFIASPGWPPHLVDRRSDYAPPIFRNQDNVLGYQKRYIGMQAMDRSDVNEYQSQVQRLNDLVSQNRNNQLINKNTEAIYNRYPSN